MLLSNVRAEFVAEHTREENVSLCAYLCDGPRTRQIRSRDAFSYIYDHICHMALYLAEITGDSNALKGAGQLRTPKFDAREVLETPQVDEKLTACFRRFEHIADNRVKIFKNCDINEGKNIITKDYLK